MDFSQDRADRSIFQVGFRRQARDVDDGTGHDILA
jgi:hypothetical protein